MPHALLLKYPGTNCDVETERALRTVGFSTQVQPIATAAPEHVAKSQLVVISGGFSYGDYVTSGRLAQLGNGTFPGRRPAQAPRRRGPYPGHLQRVPDSDQARHPSFLQLD